MSGVGHFRFENIVAIVTFSSLRSASFFARRSRVKSSTETEILLARITFCRETGSENGLSTFPFVPHQPCVISDKLIIPLQMSHLKVNTTPCILYLIHFGLKNWSCLCIACEDRINYCFPLNCVHDSSSFDFRFII